MLRNQAQRRYVVAANANGRVSGEAANITSQVSKDGGAFAAVTDTNPTEIGSSGVYYFDITADESNGNEITFVDACAASGVEVFPWPSNYPPPTPTAAASATGAVTGGLFNGSEIRVYQDDDVEGQFAIVFEITKEGTDFSGVTSVLFDAGSTPGTPTITGTCTIVSAGVGSMTVSVVIANTALQGDPQSYPYSLKAVIGTKRHTIHTGTLDVAATYQTFRP